MAAAVAGQTGRLRVHASVSGAKPPAPAPALFVRRARAGVRALGCRAVDPPRRSGRARATWTRRHFRPARRHVLRARRAPRAVRHSDRAESELDLPASRARKSTGRRRRVRRARFVACVMPGPLAGPVRGSRGGAPGLAPALFCAMMEYCGELLLIRSARCRSPAHISPAGDACETLWPLLRRSRVRVHGGRVEGARADEERKGFTHYASRPS